MNLIKHASCDEEAIYEAHPFLVKDILASAILVAANEALLEIAALVGAPEEDRAVISGWIERGRRALEECWDPDLGLYLDRNLRAGRLLRARTIAGFAPMLAGQACSDRPVILLEILESPEFMRHRGLRWLLPPATGPEDPGFEPRSYRRGPTWPIVNWLFWQALIRAGEYERSERLRRSSLEQLAAGGFGEYFDPFTGQPLGVADRSWTAAVALDWLSDEPLADVDPAT